MLRFFKWIIPLTITVCGLTVAVATSDRWLPRLGLTSMLPDAPVTTEPSAGAGPNEQVKLSEQAQQNLKLISKPLQPTTYWRTITLPGTVVDRPGISDRGVVAPVTAVVTKVHHFPGDTVRPGEPLFTLRLVGESFHTAQTELFKAAKETEITQEQRKRLSELAVGGAIPQARIIDLDNELRRLAVSLQAYRQDLQIRGLSPDQIDGIMQGAFVSEIVVLAPEARSLSPEGGEEVFASNGSPRLFEIQELRAEIGHQVQAGQMLCLLSHHESLFIEGRAFRLELPLLQRAAEHGWPVQVKLAEQEEADWPSPIAPASIHYLSNTLNADNRTLSFFLPLSNQSRTYERDGRTVFLWRFRPGQRVRLTLQVEKLENVFVLPPDAVVKEGPEVFLFRQNGDLFDRKPVRLLLQTPDEVVLANDGSVPPGIYVAQVGAVQLNRVLKSQSGEPSAGFHVHADGSVHINH